MNMSDEELFDYDDVFEDNDTVDVPEPVSVAPDASDLVESALNKMGPALTELSTLEEKIVRFQRAKGLEPDGLVDSAYKVLFEQE
jgi:hypothetical protein